MSPSRAANAAPEPPKNARTKRVSAAAFPVFDKRTKVYRRMQTLAAQFIGQLGGAERVSPLQLSAVRRAVELTVLAESARLRRLEGSTDVTLDDVVRCDRLASQAQRALGISVRAEVDVAAKPGGQTLEEIALELEQQREGAGT